MWWASLEGGSRTANDNSRWWAILCPPVSKLFGGDCLDKLEWFEANRLSYAHCNPTRREGFYGRSLACASGCDFNAEIPRLRFGL